MVVNNHPLVSGPCTVGKEPVLVKNQSSKKHNKNRASFAEVL